MTLYVNGKVYMPGGNLPLFDPALYINARPLVGGGSGGGGGDGERPTPGPGIVAHYKGDDLDDSSGSLYHLQVTTGTARHANFALLGEAGFLFESTTYQLITLEQNLDFVLLGAMSLEGLFMFRGNTTQCMVQFGGPSSDIFSEENVLWSWRILASGVPEYGQIGFSWEHDTGGIGTDEDTYSGVAIPYNTPVYLAVTRNSGASVVKHYINGVLASTVATPNPPVGGIASQLTIGNLLGGTEPFDGYMSDLQIYNVENSAEDIRARALQALPSIP